MSTKLTSSSTDYVPVPAGTHHGICIGVIDLGTQPSQLYGSKPKIILTWELPNETITIKDKDSSMEVPRLISREFTASLHKKSVLRPMLAAWRGRDFTEAELEGFELKNLLTINGLVTVAHTVKDGKTYANVSTVSGLMKGMTKLQPHNPTIHFDLDTFLDAGGGELPKEIPDWIKSKIMASDEWLAFKDPNKTHPPVQEDAKEEISEDASF